MTTTEKQIRDLLINEEERAPLAGDAMPRLQRGIVRSRQRRRGTVVAAAIAVAAAITVPLLMHGSARSGPAKSPTATGPHHPAARGITVRSMFTPTWLPDGLVETGRNAQIHSRPDNHPAFLTRSFSSTKSQQSVAITDLRGPAPVPKSATPVTIAGRSGMGWADRDSASYVIQVEWSPGHWLQVGAGDGQPTKSIAVRVGNAIVVRNVSLQVPITCRGTGCGSFSIAGISGTNRDVLIQLIGDPLMIDIDHSSSHAPDTVVIRLGSGIYAHFANEPGTKQPLTRAQLVATARTFRVHGKLHFSWMGKRP